MSKNKKRSEPASPEQISSALSEMLKALHVATGGGSPILLLNSALSVVLSRIIEDGCSPEALKSLCEQRVDLIVKARAELEDDEPRIIVPGERDVKH